MASTSLAPERTPTVAEQLKRYEASRPRKTVAEQLYAYVAKIDREWQLSADRGAMPDADGNLIPVPEKPPGYDARHPLQERESSWQEKKLRGLQLGGQATARGVLDAAALVPDLVNLGLTGLSRLSEKGSSALGVDLDLPDFLPTSDYVANRVADAAETALGDGAVIDREDMSEDERTLYSAQRLGAEAIVGSGLISRFKHALPRSLTAPHAAPGSSARVMAGDAAAGVGSGIAIEEYEQAVPEDVKERLGPLGRIIAGLAGGIGGASTLRASEGAVDTARGTAGRFAVMPEGVVPRDPETMLPINRRDFENAATMLQRNFASDESLASAKRRIEDYLERMEGGAPHPTTALIADDPSMLVAERRARATDPAPFIAADRAVMDHASKRVSSLRDESAVPSDAILAADNRAFDMRRDATAAIDRAEGAAEAGTEKAQELADVLAMLSADQASRNLDRVLVEQTYLPARAEKNRMYDLASESDAAVPMSGASQASQDLLARHTQGSAALRDPEVERLARAFDHDGAGPEMQSLSGALADRSALSRVEKEARAQGAFTRSDTARALRRGVTEDLDAAAASGAPGTEALANADQFYRERFAPFFREGNASPEFFKSIDRDPKRGSTPPEATARRFLLAGPNSRAAAKDIAKILEIAPNRDDGIRAAREYVLADAVSKGLIRKNVVSETFLSAYMSKREGMFAALPDLKAEFDRLLADVRAGTAERNHLADVLKVAKRQADLTEKQINSGALRLLIDREPGKAVAAVLADSDPAARMRELKKLFAGNDAAREGWKAAVVDHLSDRITTASKAAVSDGNDTISLPKLRAAFQRHERALAEIFEPDEMQTLQQVQRRLEILSRRGALASGGSSTVETAGGLQGVLLAMARPIGTVATIAKGALVGGSMERRARLIAQQFPDANAGARRILARVPFDPELAKHLMDFPTSDAQVYRWSKRLNQLIVLSEAAEE